jgi:hypothetical protein
LRGSAMASLGYNSTALGTSGGASYGGMTFNTALPSFSGGGGAQVDTVRRLRRNTGGYGNGGGRSRQPRPSSAGRMEQRVEFSVNSDPVWRS